MAMLRPQIVIPRCLPAKPILKYVGGKTKLLPELIKRLPRDGWGTYYEPFVGGGALFFRLAPKRAVVGDRNADLIDLYRVIKIGPAYVESIDEALREYEEVFNEMTAKGRRAYFNAMRDRWNTSRRSMHQAYRAATMLFLNRSCFNGLWRENKSGEFNSPVGDYKKITLPSRETLAAASRVLRNAELVATDFARTIRDAERGDLIYFDSPYDPVSKTSNFTSYGAGGFDQLEQQRLALLATHLVERGVRVMLSNNDTRLIRTLYRDRDVFRIHRVKAPRSINSRTDKRGLVSEVIITGGYDLPRRLG